ncbi:MAG: Gamma-glutamyltranspeptidase @ Glutathione hydrolase [uncultured Rubrobacteraceae bacterium]|uniref:Glutathione hydrolase proenzyme n=1 Tax=uncultured Rubrobacteraceae bacterium TaxID=349277 RepID=A0A6J4QX62_9ACTN|nr:MAG: Gamma-glutamyltranspeptidase @ Glutathione hydrolase [uncultured Rubrobacteraceae bacterium]
MNRSLTSLLKIVLLIAALGLVLPASGALGAKPVQTTKQPTASGTGGAVATVDHDASQVGMQVLKEGGNAVDAAVATAAALGVTEPYSCGIGGGGFMVIYDASEESVSTIDSRETAPAAFQEDSFLENGQPIPFAERVTSGLGVGVPGTIDGWEQALGKFGSRPLSELLQPSIRLAARGFVVDQTYRQQTVDNLARFEDFTSTRETFLRNGQAPAVGSTFRNPDLAATYSRVADGGGDAFYSGRTARAIVDTVQNPPVVADPGRTVRAGLMTTADLSGYSSLERAPTESSYRGMQVYGMGPPSSGGSTVGEALNILEGYPMSDLTLPRDDALHYYLEASRYSFADRGKYLGDPAYVDVPLTGLLSDEFAAERRELITEVAAEHPVAPGNPCPYNGGEPCPSDAQASTAVEGPSTTHLTVSDESGNIVSYTFTIEQTGGSAITVPRHGFILNNELTDFEPVPGLANSPDGGKRPRSSMSPTIVTDTGDDPIIALGSPGGSTIITTVFQVLVNDLDFGMTLPEAIEAPRVSQRNTVTTSAEPEFLNSPEAAALVSEHGQSFTSTPELGAATGIAFLPDGTVQAAAEPVRRGGGSALVENPVP